MEDWMGKVRLQPLELNSENSSSAQVVVVCLETGDKAALTRAKKKGPQAVIDAVNAAFAEWDEKFPAWPDDWRIWQNAKNDAEYHIRTGHPTNSWS